ncbi:hypothetical protein PR048_024837 [Dryococelus australis]|uniref:Uncharacterized protein n=1 Tax=Dryococelus australis TaxID=614101 RepID=A0ABQ9GPR3_9NEOP|nr:hypothetical protein PR048_024837 [Dryococelus australis]
MAIMCNIEAAAYEWLDSSPSTKANRFKSPAWSLPDFFKLQSMPLVSGFSRGSPVSPRPCNSTLHHFHLISASSALKSPFAPLAVAVLQPMQSFQKCSVYREQPLEGLWIATARHHRPLRIQPITQRTSVRTAIHGLCNNYYFSAHAVLRIARCRASADRNRSPWFTPSHQQVSRILELSFGYSPSEVQSFDEWIVLLSHATGSAAVRTLRQKPANINYFQENLEPALRVTVLAALGSFNSFALPVSAVRQKQPKFHNASAFKGWGRGSARQLSPVYLDGRRIVKYYTIEASRDKMSLAMETNANKQTDKTTARVKYSHASPYTAKASYLELHSSFAPPAVKLTHIPTAIIRSSDKRNTDVEMLSNGRTYTWGDVSWYIICQYEWQMPTKLQLANCVRSLVNFAGTIGCS